MRAIAISIVASLLPSATLSFVPSPRSRIATPLRATTSEGDIDIEHAKYCADHFGECSLDEMEQLRNGTSDRYI